MSMPNHNFTKIYTRPTRVQDFEIPIVGPQFVFPNSPLTEVIYIGLGNAKWEGWYHEDEFHALMEMYAAVVRSDSWSLEAHSQEFLRDVSLLRDTTLRLIDTAKHSFDTPDMLAVYRAYVDAWNRYHPYIWIPWSITYVLEDWFVQELQKKFSDWQTMYNALAVSTKPIQMQQLIEALLEWKIRGSDTSELKNVVEQFGHLAGYSVNDRYWTEDDLLRQIDSFQNPDEDLTHMRKEREIIKKRVEKVWTTLRHAPELLRTAKIIHAYVFLRTERADQYKWALTNAAQFYRIFEHNFKLPFGYAGHLTKKEMNDALETRALPEADELRERAKENYVIFLTPEKTRVIADPKEREAFIQSKIPDLGQNSVSSTAHGRIAYSGVVRGKARVILHLKDVPNMQPGEILIANMTHPDYMPAIYKAAAIVTDEGGIVCHAAIISRELKIPCVIGTRDATKIFQTGDMVEVDAEQGMVKKELEAQKKGIK